MWCQSPALQYPFDAFIKSNICWQNAVSNFKHAQKPIRVSNEQTENLLKLFRLLLATMSCMQSVSTISSNFFVVLISTYFALMLVTLNAYQNIYDNCFSVGFFILTFGNKPRVHLLKNALDLFALYWIFNLRAFQRNTGQHLRACCLAPARNSHVCFCCCCAVRPSENRYISKCRKKASTMIWESIH